MQTGLTPPIEDNIRPFVELFVFLWQFWPVMVLIIVCAIVWIAINLIDNEKLGLVK
jgi:hypothetical protein